MIIQAAGDLKPGTMYDEMFGGVSLYIFVEEAITRKTTPGLFPDGAFEIPSVDKLWKKGVLKKQDCYTWEVIDGAKALEPCLGFVRRYHPTVHWFTGSAPARSVQLWGVANGHIVASVGALSNG